MPRPETSAEARDPRSAEGAPAPRATAGSLVISLDFEIAWGRHGAADFATYLPLYRETRPVVRRLIELFARHDVPATWATVGKLIDPDGPAADPAFDGGCDPRDTEGRSIFYAPDLLDALRASPAAHDIGSHSYHHTVFGAGTCDTDTARADLDRMAAAHRRLGLATTSFVFPKNSVAHLDALRAAGVRVIRGPDRRRLRTRLSGANRLGNALVDSAPVAPATVLPRRDGGLVDLPGSMLFRIPYTGRRRHLPGALLAARAKRGLDAAAARGEAFHLWFHPFNFAYRPQAHFDAFEATLAHANRLRAQGRLQVRTMADYAG